MGMNTKCGEQPDAKTTVFGYPLSGGGGRTQLATRASDPSPKPRCFQVPLDASRCFQMFLDASCYPALGPTGLTPLGWGHRAGFLLSA